MNEKLNEYHFLSMEVKSYFFSTSLFISYVTFAYNKILKVLIKSKALFEQINFQWQWWTEPKENLSKFLNFLTN